MWKLTFMFGQSIWPFNFFHLGWQVMKGKRLEAHIWRFIGNQTCHQCWKMLAWADSWSLQSLRLFMCLGQPYSSINFWSFLLWDWPKKCGINGSSMPQIGVWWCCQFDLAKCGKSHPWVHQRIIWPWGGYSWVWRCSSAVRIYTFLFFDQNKKGKMSNFIFSSWTSRGTGSTFVSYSIWNGTHPPNRPGGPCDIQTTYGCRDLEPDFVALFMVFSSLETKKMALYWAVPLNSFFKFLQ